MINRSSLHSRIVVSALALAMSGFINTGAACAQDISGGASVVLANADVEAKFGKGIFSTPKNTAHAPKPVEKKTVARAAHTTHPQRTTVATNKPETPRKTEPSPRKVESSPRKVVTKVEEVSSPRESSRPSDESSKPADESTKPLGEPAKTVQTAESLNKQGDDYFDAGQYQKAIDAYQQAVRLQPDYPEAYLNLGDAYYNLDRYDEAVAADKQAIALRPDWAAAYHALGNAYLKLDRSAEAIEALKHAVDLDPKDEEARSALSLAYYDQGVAAYNANRYEEAVVAYQQAVNFKPDYAEAHNNLGDAYRRLVGAAGKSSGNGCQFLGHRRYVRHRSQRDVDRTGTQKTS
jgi:Flp pilus assembly protein TadD